jgi:flagellar protein FliO/FliZ
MGAVESIGRVLLSLALVLGVMWVLGRWARSRTGTKGKSRETLTVLARQQLTRNASVAVVKIADRALVLGVTDGHVNLLGDADLSAVEAGLTPATGRRSAARAATAPRPLTVTPDELDDDLRALIPSTSASASAPRRASRHASKPAGRSALEGSALSLSTWVQAIDAVRERTVR